MQTSSSFEQTLIEKIKSHLGEAEVNLSGADCSFSLVVVSNHFEGVSLLNRQRQIMGLFQEEIASGRLHALSLKTYTHSEFEKIQAQQ